MKIPFSIKYRPQIESGEYRVETQAGCPVRIVCWDMACELPILGLVLLNDEKAEEMAVGFTNEGTNLFGEPLYDKLFIVTPEEELTEFEKKLWEVLKSEGSPIGPIEKFTDSDNEVFHSYAAKLLAIAREQFIKDGYVIEKKAFHDAVENISDKHRAEMSVEYSLHCKIEDGTRHAIMNWEAFQKVAQKFIDVGKAEALKDLPRWKKVGVDTGQTNLIKGYKREEDELYRNGKCISLVSLEKLPGFKEDSHE